ncbi:MAG: polysaccharide deacetylase family protein [Sedimentisphaerales bacterium]
MLNVLTVDVEDGWSTFSRDRLSREIEPTETVVKDTERILDILSARSVRATFFVVGKVAETFPSLVKRIAGAGHEIGIHGFYHKQIFRLTPDEFRLEIKRAKSMLEDLVSVAVVGHRAPAFSVAPETRWSLRILAEEGFRYDSSIVPCKNPRYGWKGFSKDICRIDLGDGLSIVEVPMSILPIPMTSKGFMTGGGYLRHFPYFVSYAAIKHIQKTRPVIVYMHPYEFGKEVAPLPMEHLPIVSRWRARWQACWSLGMGVGNRHTMPAKVQKLLSAFEFSTAGCVIDQWFGRD